MVQVLNTRSWKSKLGEQLGTIAGQGLAQGLKKGEQRERRQEDLERIQDVLRPEQPGAEAFAGRSALPENMRQQQQNMESMEAEGADVQSLGDILQPKEKDRSLQSELLDAAGKMRTKTGRKLATSMFETAREEDDDEYTWVTIEDRQGRRQRMPVEKDRLPQVVKAVQAQGSRVYKGSKDPSWETMNIKGADGKVRPIQVPQSQFNQRVKEIAQNPQVDFAQDAELKTVQGKNEQGEPIKKVVRITEGGETETIMDNIPDPSARKQAAEAEEKQETDLGEIGAEIKDAIGMHQDAVSTILDRYTDAEDNKLQNIFSKEMEGEALTSEEESELQNAFQELKRREGENSEPYKEVMRRWNEIQRLSDIYGSEVMQRANKKLGGSKEEESDQRTTYDPTNYSGKKSFVYDPATDSFK